MFVAVLSACAENGGTGTRFDASKPGVRITPPHDSMSVGSTQRLTAEVTNRIALGRPATVTWTSLNSTVATVNANGDIVALSSGLTHIVASIGTSADTTTIYVRAGSLIVEPNAVATAIGEEVRLTVYTQNRTAASGVDVHWSSADSAIARVSNDGTVTALGAGDAVLVATVGGERGTAVVSVRPRDISSLRLTPTTSSLYPSKTEQLALTAYDDAGRAMTVPIDNAKWSTTNATVLSVDDAGLVTGKVRGNAVVTAKIGSKAATASVNVLSEPVTSVTVGLASTLLDVGQTTQATATLLNTAGTAFTGPTVAWQSSNSAIAAVNASGVVTAVARGTVTISAVADGKTGGAALTVGPKSVATVVVSPNPASAAVGQTAQLTATAKDAAGTALVGRAITWASSNAAVATVSNTGVVSAVSMGSATISATANGVTGQTQFNTTAVTAASVTVSPSSPNATVGQQVQLIATVYDAAGTVLASRAPAWSSSNPAVATVSTTGLVTAVAKGNASISASVDGKSAAATLSVDTPPPAPVASLTVTLGSSNLNVGQSTQAVAVTRDAAGNVLTGRTITWSSAEPTLATVSSSGSVAAIAPGSVSIVATSEGISNSATLVVTNPAPAPVSTVTLSASSTAMLVGQTQAISVILRDAAGNSLSGRTIAWSSSNTAAINVSPSGQASAVGAGSAVVTATSEGKSGTLSLTVTAPATAPASVSVTAPTTRITVGQTVQATATALDAHGTALTGRTVTWSSSSPAIATVSASGLVTAVAGGTTAINAAVEGVVGTLAITASTSTDVAPVAPVASVRVTLAQSSIQMGQSTQATAVALDASGNAISAGSATWSSSNTSVAAVSASGLVSSVGTGQATISATISGKSGSGTISVSAPVSGGTALATAPTLPQSVPGTSVGAALRVVRVAAGGDLQAALNGAQPGDEIRLASGATWTGNYVIPATASCSVSSWITLRSDVADTQLPAPGTRITPSYSSVLAKIVTTNGDAALRTAGPTCGWRLLGIELVAANAVTVLNYGIVRLGDGGWVGGGEIQTSLSKVPQDFILDRAYLHGTTTANVVRCVVLNSGRTAIINSWISDCHAKGFDSQAVEGWNGPGPYLIENNFLAGAGENVMFGGADPGIAGLSPADITIRRNHVWKDPSWKGVWTVKNLFELKNARRVLVEGNIFENNWVDGQSGMAIVIKSSQDQCGTCTWEGTTDVTFRHNIVRNSPRGFNAQAVDCSGQACVDVHVQRVRVENNLFENIGSFNGSTGDGWLALLTHDLTDVALIHNTFVGNLASSGIALVMDYGAGAAKRIQLDDNVFAGHADYAVFYSGTQVGTASLQAMAGTSWSYARNVVGNVDPSFVSKFPAESWYPSITGIGFTSTSDYRLSSASAYKGRGAGGTDPGADFDELGRRTGGVKVAMP